MLYNILISSSKIKSILDKIVPIPKDRVYELELKLKSNRNDFYEFINYLKSIDNIRFESFDDTVYSYNIDDKNNVRKIEGKDKRTEYLIKNRIISEDVTFRHSINKQYDYKLSLSTEQTIDKGKFKENSVSYVRVRNRTSFFIENLRIDLTEVTTTLIEGKQYNKKSYEVEIEFLTLPNNALSLDSIKRYISFSEEFKKALHLLFPKSHTLVSIEHERYNEIMSIIQDHVENKPINIQNKYLQVLQNEDGIANYSVTNKLDGTKYNLFLVVGTDNKVHTILLMNNTDIWLLYDNLSYIDISLKSRNTIYAADVEIIETTVNNRLKIEIYIFDVIFSKLAKSILDKNHYERLNEIPESIIEQVNSIDLTKTNFKVDFNIRKKNFVYNKSLQNSLKSIVKYMWSTFGDITNVEEMNDGIIFQPYTGKYAKDIAKPILKWKFPEKVTIDFQIKNTNESNLYRVYIYNDQVDRLEEFVYNRNTYKLFSEEKLAEDTIVETTFDISSQQFIPYRIRYDKTRPNSINTAIDTFRDLIQPFLLKRIVDYLNGIMPPEEVEIEQKEETVYENIVLPCEKGIIEKLFFLPRVGSTPLSEKEICYLQVTSDTKRFALGFRTTQFVLNEIIKYLGVIGKQLSQSTIMDCFGYSGSEATVFSTGKLAKGERPQKFKQIITLESDETNMKSIVNNLNVFNNKFYANEPYKAFKNIILDKSDFITQSQSVIQKYNPNILFINKLNFPDLREFVLNIFKTFPQIDLIVFKVYPNFNTKTLNLTFEFKFGVLYIPRCLNIYRKIHNEIKSYLIQEYCNKPKILDLGAGKGGDLFKYNNNLDIKKIYLVEPNEENIRELKERLNKLQTIKTHEYDLIIINAKSQDTEKIVNAIKNEQTNSKVNVVSSFFQ